jgi:hypothetical protein
MDGTAGSTPKRVTRYPHTPRNLIEGRAEMDLAVRLDDVSSGRLIRTLEARGYRVFPAARVEETGWGWAIYKTGEEVNRVTPRVLSEDRRSYRRR